MPRLQQIDLQCAASVAAMPPSAHLIDENLRGYVVLLSAHFQGFCRDLCTECAQVIASKVRPSLRALIREQFAAHRKLDQGNPSSSNLKEDFKRFGFLLDLTVDPTNRPRLDNLSELNKWRNVAAHQGTSIPLGTPLTLPSLRKWRSSCDGLATSLDSILHKSIADASPANPMVTAGIGDQMMTLKKTLPLFQIGDRVRIHYSEWKGRIVEYRGPLAPGGKHVYRVRIPDKPKPIYIELPEDEMTPIPMRRKATSPSASQAPEAPEQQGDGSASSFSFFRKGDRVKIRDSNWQGRIVELRIPPSGVYVYRVRVPAEPRSIYVELPANYLVAVPSRVKKGSKSSARPVRGKRKKG